MTGQATAKPSWAKLPSIWQTNYNDPYSVEVFTGAVVSGGVTSDIISLEDPLLQEANDVIQKDFNEKWAKFSNSILQKATTVTINGEVIEVQNGAIKVAA